MGLYQKYADLTIDEVCQAWKDIDKISHPSEAIELKNEIEHRRAHGEIPSERNNHAYVLSGDRLLQKLEKLPDLPLSFNGTSREYFKIWIVNLCLSLLTLGIFSAWAKVRKKRYFYSHTTIAGTPFQYLGMPVPILKGRLIAAVGFLAYYASSHFFISLFPFVMGAGLVLAPWVLVRSAAFNSRYSAFRNMTFHFKANYIDGLKALYAYGIVPAFVIGIAFEWFGNIFFTAAVSLIFSFHLPFLICRVKRFLITNTVYGGKNGDFGARGGQYFQIYFVSGLVFSAFVVPIGFLISMVSFSGESNKFLLFLLPLLSYIGYVLAYAYVRSKTTNLVWQNTQLGPLKFYSDMQFIELCKLYITNALGIILSCGLMIPWAVIRTMKYRADHMRVFLDGGLIEFYGSEEHSVAAAGAEAVDLFEWDLSV